MHTPRADRFPHAARGNAGGELVRPTGAGHRQRLAGGSGTVRRPVARSLRARLHERHHPDRFQAGRAGPPGHDGTLRHRPCAAIIFPSMRGFLLRLLITALGLWVADQLLPGIAFASTGALIVSALVLGVVNAVIRPIILILTLPLTVLTLGLFILIVNGISLALVAWLVPGFHIAGLWAATIGAIIVGLTSWAASAFIGGAGRGERLETGGGTARPTER